MKNYKYMVNPQREIQRILPFSSCIVFLSLIMPCPLDQLDSMLPDLLVSIAGLHFGLCWNDGCSGKERFMVQLWRSEVCHVILQANCILLGTLDSSQICTSQSHCICYSFDLKFWVLNRLGQGRDKALQYLRENPLLCSEVEKVCLITFGSYMWIVILSLDIGIRSLIILYATRVCFSASYTVSLSTIEFVMGDKKYKTFVFPSLLLL